MKLSKKIFGMAAGMIATFGLATVAMANQWQNQVYVWPNNTAIPGGTLSVGYSMVSGSLLNTGVAAGTTTIDWSLGNVQRLQMPAGNTTVAFTNLVPGEEFKLAVQQDGTGSRLITWPTSPAIKWSGGSAPTLTTTANKTDVISFYYDQNGNVYETAIELNE